MRSYIYQQRIVLELKYTRITDADIVNCDFICDFPCTKEQLNDALKCIFVGCTFRACRIEHSATGGVLT